ncbi:hypothetical protein TIFTF001_039242 [Ficus carica]|uniref:RNase H type-1 domain-containing protein n=1 Tax=Ficus carica TaxID=3494 RepID=A0AA88E8T3_FICCA|nr:hypothetical protein TIFTF001_039242 [Ficus carica]
MVLWFVWKDRNLLTHGGHPRDASDILEAASVWLGDYPAARGCLGETDIGSASIDQHWKAPMSGLLKLNADASVFKDCDVVGIGGIIRNSEGQVIGAIAKKLSGLFFPYAAECLAIRKGILFAKQQGLNISSMESGFSNAVKAVDEHFLFAVESPIVNDIKILMVETSGGKLFGWMLFYW